MRVWMVGTHEGNKENERIFSMVAETVTYSVISCANTTTQVLAVNPGRISVLLENDSTQTIWIKTGADAVANEGIRLDSNGGSYYMSDVNENLDRLVVNGIVASGTGNLLVIEWANT